MWVIKLVVFGYTEFLFGDSALPHYVVGFSNTEAKAETTVGIERAKTWQSEEEATKWGNKYLTAHEWSVEPARQNA